MKQNGHYGCMPWKADSLDDPIVRGLCEILSDVPKPVGIVLDFGCGLGNKIPFIRGYTNFDSYVGYDISRVAIDEAMKRYSANDGIRFVNNLDSGFHVDLIIASLVLQHIMDDEEFEYAVNFLGRSLEDGGTIIVIDNVTENKKDLGYIKFRSLDRHLQCFEKARLNVIKKKIINVGEEQVCFFLLNKMGAKNV